MIFLELPRDPEFPIDSRNDVRIRLYRLGFLATTGPCVSLDHRSDRTSTTEASVQIVTIIKKLKRRIGPDQCAVEV
jgi:hypothetical protein